MRFSPKLLTTAFILALAVTALPAPASAQPPPLPHAFYGEVTVNGQPAPAGTTVEARGEGVRTGIEGNPLTVTEPGKYGGAGGFDPKLVVQGDVKNGTLLYFFVDGVQAQCAQPGGAWTDSYAFEVGGITELNLRVGAAAAPTATPKAATATSTATAELAATQAASPTREATSAATPTTRATVTSTATKQLSPTRGATATLMATRPASPTTEATVAPTATEQVGATTVAMAAPTATEEAGLALATGRSPEPANTPSSSEEPTTSPVGWILAIVLVAVVAGLYAWFKMRRQPSRE